MSRLYNRAVEVYIFCCLVFLSMRPLDGRTNSTTVNVQLRCIDIHSALYLFDIALCSWPTLTCSSSCFNLLQVKKKRKPGVNPINLNTIK